MIAISSTFKESLSGEAAGFQNYDEFRKPSIKAYTLDRKRMYRGFNLSSSVLISSKSLEKQPNWNFARK